MAKRPTLPVPFIAYVDNEKIPHFVAVWKECGGLIVRYKLRKKDACDIVAEACCKHSADIETATAYAKSRIFKQINDERLGGKCLDDETLVEIAAMETAAKQENPQMIKLRSVAKNGRLATVVKLVDEGKDFREIAEILGIGRAAFWHWLRKKAPGEYRRALDESNAGVPV